jgi:hypothetical protein
MSNAQTGKKDVKEYLHLYLGCECLAKKPQSMGADQDTIRPDMLQQDYWEWIKPILRPLSDMTEEEREQLNDIELGESSWPTVAIALAPCFKYLLSKHFDLFGLIESGLAIDKTKKPNP